MVAMKRVQAQPNKLQSVQTEFKILSTLRHPRIVGFLNFYESPNSWKFVLEYMVNGSLRDLLNQMKRNGMTFSEDRLIHTYMDIAVGVQFLHSQNVLHRDLKPENILVDENNRLKIADFGISKMHSGAANANYGHTACGTKYYMAPEVHRGSAYCSKCDIWSLGVIFYELATREYPWNDDIFHKMTQGPMRHTGPMKPLTQFRYTGKMQRLLHFMTIYNPPGRKDINFICDRPFLKDAYTKLCHERMGF
jgi:serine/threonine protein kinase